LYIVGEEVDHNAVGAAISAITSNLPEMTRGVRMIAALMDDDTNGDKLLDAARHLCSAFSDMLKAAEPETKEVILGLKIYFYQLKD
jgi:talin